VLPVHGTGRSGRGPCNDVTLRLELTDEHGAKVTQNVIRAYGVR
jgi:hypothetical protein